MTEQFKPPPRSLEERIRDLEVVVSSQHELLNASVEAIKCMHKTNASLIDAVMLLAKARRGVTP